MAKGGDYMKALHMAAYTLLWVGGVNWGVMGLFDGYNIVEMLLGSWPQLVQFVYILVGISALYTLATHMGDCRVCGAGKKK